jgi:prolyl-tRNA editing enzyme YbaK/EbsC (Cys-tRNA(Pro) deacylase)
MSLPASSLRVVAAAQDLGFDMKPTVFPEGARTAAAAAEAIGCRVAQIVKSLVFMADDSPVMVLMSGDRRVDPAKLSAAVGGAVVRRASLDEVRAATGYAAGGTPPLGHVQPLDTVADRSLERNEQVWAAAGTPTTVFPIEVERLVDLAGARWVDVAEGTEDDG